MNKQTQELQHNELVDWLEAKFGHLRPHSSKIIFMILALVAIGVMVAFYLRARHEVYASQWERLNMELRQRQMDGQTRQFTDYAEEFPNDPASLWAWQFAADGELSAGLRMLVSQWDEGRRRLERAKTYYTRVLESTAAKSPLLLERANYGLAYCLESLGDFEAAKQQYQKFIDQAPNSALAKPAREALQRINNPAWVAFHQDFYKIGIAPGLILPTRPDISFPDLDAVDETAPGGEPPGSDQSGEQADQQDQSSDDGQSDQTDGDGDADGNVSMAASALVSLLVQR
ncbi:MAG TPA: tetratricopeptide repeat protein [Pirellulaceae bacterium]|nr:tetratricopeptide repeat protein [Pirellulaceae bacterium]